MKKKKIDCCWDNLNEAKYVSRAYWVCPVCGKDVSLMYVLMQETKEKTEEIKQCPQCKNILDISAFEGDICMGCENFNGVENRQSLREKIQNIVFKNPSAPMKATNEIIKLFQSAILQAKPEEIDLTEVTGVYENMESEGFNQGVLQYENNIKEIFK